MCFTLGKKNYMKTTITDDLATMWNGRNGEAVDDTLAAYDRINNHATREDVPQLLSFIEQDDIGFWIRELLMVPILFEGGSRYLLDVFEAMRKNEAEGHNNAILTSELEGYVEMNPDECRPLLKTILAKDASLYRDYADWLLEYCEQ